jgi:hypothetical protein
LYRGCFHEKRRQASSKSDCGRTVPGIWKQPFDPAMLQAKSPGITDQILKVHKFQLDANDESDIVDDLSAIFSGGARYGYTGNSAHITAQARITPR